MAITWKALDDRGGVEGTGTQTTTNAYVACLTWDCLHVPKKTIVLTETGGSNDIKYKVLVRARIGGQQVEDVQETTLSASGHAAIQYEYPWAEIEVQVKAATGGSQGDLQIDCVGQSQAS